MNGKQNIIGRILSDADDKAAYIVSQAQMRADEAIAKEHAAIAADKKALETKLAVAAQERVANALANAKLDARKYRLAGRQQLISLCYANALASLEAMDEVRAAEFIAATLAKYAESGEQVFVGKAQAGVVTQAFLDKLGKNLTLGGSTDVGSGVVLCGDGYEKDLTYAKLIDYARDKTEAEVSVALFGVKNV